MENNIFTKSAILNLLGIYKIIMKNNIMNEDSPFIKLLHKLGCINMSKVKNKFWLLSSGALMKTSEGITVKDAEEITEYQYRKIKKERAKQSVIADEVAANGCYIDEEDNIYL